MCYISAHGSRNLSKWSRHGQSAVSSTGCKTAGWRPIAKGNGFGLIRYVHRHWMNWGQDMRRSPPSWPSKNCLYRAGYLSGKGTFGPRIPKIEYSTQAFYQLNNIWQAMPDDLHRLTYVLYAVPWFPGPIPVWKRQKKALGLSKSEYYRQVHTLHLYTEERLPNFLGNEIAA